MRFYSPDIRSATTINKTENNEAHKIAKNAFEKYSNLAYALPVSSSSYHLCLSSSFLIQSLINVTFLGHYNFLSATTEQGRTHGNVANSMLPADNITRISSCFTTTISKSLLDSILSQCNIVPQPTLSYIFLYHSIYIQVPQVPFFFFRLNSL